MIEIIIKNAATISTVMFFAIFCFVCFLVFKKGAKEKFENYSKIPLSDD